MCVCVFRCLCLSLCLSLSTLTVVRHPENNDSGSFGFFAGISVTVGPFCFVSGTVTVGLILFVLFYVVCFLIGTVAVGLILFVLCCLFLCFLIGTVAMGLVLFVVLCFCIFFNVVFNYMLFFLIL